MLEQPRARRQPVKRSHHGRDFDDPYEWLRDKDSQDTRDYLEAENAYTEQQTAHLKGLSSAIFEEIKGRIKETDMSVPSRAEKYWYFSRTEEGKSYGSSCRIAVEGDSWEPPVVEPGVLAPGEEVILDVNELARGHDFFELGAVAATKSGRYLAYSTDTAGDERYDLVIKDLKTGELLPDRIERIGGGALWSECERFLFYTRVDDAWRPDSIWRHEIGTPVDQDVRIFYEPDEKFWVGIGATLCKKYLVIASSSKLTSEQWVCPMETPDAEFECLIPRTPGVEYSADRVSVAGHEYWVVVHNAHGPNSSIGVAPIGQLSSFDDLTEILPHSDARRVEGVCTFKRFMVMGYRTEGLSRVALMTFDDSPEAASPFTEFVDLEFDEELYSAGLGGNSLWDPKLLRMGYTSFTTPTQVLDYDVATGERIVRREQEVLGGYNAEDYVAHRDWATAKDGTRVPISVIHRADLDTSKPQPTVLYGYGSYEASMDPGFSVARLSLLDRGMVFAIAHVRGGGEMGRAWYDDGKMLHKKNTFTDFIACADHLIDQGLTDPQHLVALGGSAGGLLMGAVANMAPDRFAAIQAVVPFVDPLTSILMPELPLTVLEWEEWGDPLHDAAVYDYIKSYSPYENVTEQNYPNILAITSLNDTRVLYVEPAKWIAKLRATATGGEFLLKTEMSAGHGGVSGRYDQWKQTGLEYAWLVDQSGARH